MFMRVILIGAAACAFAATASSQSFAPPTSWNVGSNGDAIVSGDWNGDGAPDLAVGTSSSGVSSLRILLNDGAGAFPTTTTLFPQLPTNLLESGDIDGDGDLDIIGAWTGGAVDVYLNDGAGAFTRQATANGPPISFAFALDRVRLGDVNGDGLPELITVHRTSDTVFVFTNVGLPLVYSSSFTTISPGPGSRPSDVAVADIDGVGLDDLAICRQRTAGVGDVFVMLNGPAGFTGGIPISAGADPLTITAADLDSDGVVDLVTGNGYFPEITVFRNVGAATFSVQNYSSGAPLTAAIAVCDADVDGDMDLLTANSNNVGPRTSVYLNDGAGCFGLGCPSSTPIASGLAGPGTVNHTGGLVVGDFNGDDTCDVVYSLRVNTFINVHDNLANAGATYPGGGADFRMLSAVYPPAGQLPYTTGPLSDVKPVNFGDIIALRLESPGGNYVASAVLLIAQLHFTPSTINPLPTFADGWIWPTLVPGPVVLTGSGAFGAANLLLPSGNEIGFFYLGGLSGTTVVIQGYALAPNAVNGNVFFTSTDAHAFMF